ncbi:hypothetical protein EDB86DRAFT_2832579 [Lactarius hatsudake]|nr:hypothetical protein EDB86DRAFT_2832579 [Lactarius hatsudake]
MAQMLRTSSAHPLLADIATNPFRTIPAARPMPRRRNDDVSTDAFVTGAASWLASAIMHTIPSAVSDQASVGGGKMKGNYIRTLRKVTDETDVVLLVLDSHDDRGRGKLVEEQAREWCVMEDKRPAFVFNKIDPVPRENVQAFAEGPPPYDPSDSLPLPEHRPNSPWHCTGDLLHLFEVHEQRGTMRAQRWVSWCPSWCHVRRSYNQFSLSVSCGQPTLPMVSLTVTSEYRDKKWTSVLLRDMVKPEDLDDPTSDDTVTFYALPAISAPLQHFSTACQDPRAHTN